MNNQESSSITVMPTQWARYRDIGNIEPLNDGDLACLAEVSAVLKKHEMRSRFGIALLHKHFEMSPDEQLLEMTDVESRTLTIRPVKEVDRSQTIQTIWELGDGADGQTVAMACQIMCWNDMGTHKKDHKATVTGEQF